MSYEKSDEKPSIEITLSTKTGHSALCLSGGGIRSATFCLGVIQGLATKGWLDKFDYLSTVSGGGYIGSWLSSWIHHAGQTAPAGSSGVTVVTDALKQSASSEPDQIKRLRQYSNYLSPVAGMSADMFALISIYCRNLFLNWLVLLPLLAMIVVLPMLSLAFTEKMTHACEPLVKGLLALGGVAGVICIAYTTSDMPEGNRHQMKKSYFKRWCLAPLVLGCFFISLVFQQAIGTQKVLSFSAAQSSWNIRSWVDLIPNATNMLKLALGGAVVHLFGALVGLYFRRRRVPKNGATAIYTFSQVILGIVLVLVSGAAGALLLGVSAYWAQEFFRSFSITGSTRAAWLATVSVPVILLCFHIGTAIYAALLRWLAELMNEDVDEGPREWWGRSGGYCLLVAIIWIVAHVLVLWVSAYVIDLKTWVAGVGGLGGLITVLCGYFGKNSSLPAGQELKSAWTKLGGNMLSIVAALFIVALIVGASLAWVYGAAYFTGDTSSLAHHVDYLKLVACQEIYFWPLCLAISGIVMLLFRMAVGVNTFSMQSLYCNRLVRAYLGATRPSGSRNGHAFTGFDPDDDLPLSSLSRSGKLKHIINAALNISKPAADQLQYQQRKALPFSFASDQCFTKISDKPCPIATKQYAGDILLGRAMAISGAAASPNMGYHTSPLVAFVLTFFNVRLGSWLPNPCKPSNAHRKSEPSVIEPTIFAELFGMANSARDFVYLSDGGHFENLGLYEVVRRQIDANVKKFGPIVVVDASCDPEFVFDDLESCIRKMRVDLGVELVFDQGLPIAKDGYAKEHCAVGRLRKGRVEGIVIYIKPVLTGDEPEDVLRYAARCKKQNKPFPHHTTGDQFFDEAQFESYRILGLRSIDEKYFPTWPQNNNSDSASLSVPWPLHYQPKKQNNVQLDASDSSINPLLKEIVGLAPTVPRITNSTGLLAGLAALLAIPPLASLINSKSVENLLVFLPEQQTLVAGGLSAVNVIFADAQRRIAFPLFPEGGYELSTVASAGVGLVAEALQKCPINANSKIEITVQGFSSSSPKPDQRPEGGSNARNVLLADRRACAVWQVLNDSSKPSNVVYTLDAWLNKQGKNDGDYCKNILPRDHNVSMDDEVAKAYQHLDTMRKIDVKKVENKDEDYDRAVGQLNRRVDLLPMSSLGTCSIREISAIVSKGYAGGWHGTLE